MKKFQNIAIVLLFLTFIGFWGCNKNSTTENQSKSTYEKVNENGTIRVGYISYPPGFIKDPNTNQYSGIFNDVLLEVGKNLGLKIEYTQEVAWGTMVESIKQDKIDMIGSPVWPTSQRGKQVGFSVPIYYSGIGIYVRIDDNRFNDDFTKINDPNIRISTIDGELTSTISSFDFPKAKIIGLPQSTDVSQVLLNVAENKADVTFAEPVIAYEYMKKNPGKLKNIAEKKPIRIYPNVMMFKINDPAFKSMIDNAIIELMNNGYIDKIISKYEPFPGAFYRNALNYRTE